MAKLATEHVTNDMGHTGRPKILVDLEGTLRRICAALVLLVAAACAPPDAIIGVENPNVPLETVEGATVQKIFIASTRKVATEEGLLFSSERSTDISLASLNVSIPPTHQTGQVERPDALPPDPRTDFTIHDPILYGNDSAFLREVDAALAQRAPGDRKIMLFVHGYNTSTTDASLRLAQFVHDSGYKGVPVLFTWASANQTAKYVFDLNSAIIASQKVDEIQDLLDRTNAEEYDIFAHSMGTLLTMQGLVDRARTGQLNRKGRLNSVILASPDIDSDLFRSQLSQFEEVPEDFFVLLSRDDRALAVSKLIAGGVPRIGATEDEELADLGIVVVDLTEVNDRSSLSHSKFASSPAIVQLIGEGLNRHDRFTDSEAAEAASDVFYRLSVRILF